ncbi:MutS-like protein [Pseudobacter ginsenosidimutans]|uniref:MutS-like protein n=2 Tax=Pseudobacter ginsenosidimutans TaxID=661488 RepID=A0A4Q7N210_9BACT|nr:DNA mismatch repair protein [Pseudobacter ginsenosidimutans]RZS74719.1 MutS-like protein [Pseudobacter ginsenosidimutans]
MHFITDRQTLEELNLSGKFRKGTVHHLFNQVKTRGGEQLLDVMFREPLTNAASINQRSSIFQYFQQVRQDFPFDAEQVNLMREYLDAGEAKQAALVLATTLTRRLLSILTRDGQYKKNIQGLQATIVNLHKCYSFISRLQAMPGPWTEKIESIARILNHKRMERLRAMDIYKALPATTIAFYNHLLKHVLKEEMEQVLLFIYEVDVNIAVSEVAHKRGFCYAKAFPEEDNIFSARALSHPCIEGGVGNNLLLHRNSNIIFLTGANMAGKSTLMKSVGIAMYLAHMGFPVAASHLEFSVREGIYSSINVADNIGLGYSHFYAEVVRVKQAAEAAASGKSLLLMFDELFKGTNVKDAYDGTLAVTEAFASYRKCIFIVSTHIIEVGEALRKQDNIQFVYMPTIMQGSKPKYTYRLQDGITEDRQGMMIIGNEGILQMLEGEVQG